MPTTFQEALAKIKAQAHSLEVADEKAVESIILSPLLRSVGWDTDVLSEVHPQWPIPNSREKVDYSLQINGESRVFIEAKKWTLQLDQKDERHLRDYCNGAGKSTPKLAVLTNGRQWRFYIAPEKNHPILRLFLDLDIINDTVGKVEKDFSEFLARDRVETMKRAPQAAYELWKKRNEDEAIIRCLARAWNELASARKDQEALLAHFAGQKEIQAQEEHIKGFLALGGLRFNPIPVEGRPTSFTFHANGEDYSIVVKGFTDGFRELCVQMYKHHPDDFSKKTLAIGRAWISKDTDNKKNHSAIENSGAAVNNYGSAKALEERCRRIVTSLGYPPESLIIHYPQPSQG